MEIELLCDHSDLIPTLTKIYQSEWEPYYGCHGPGDAQADLTSRCNRHTLPVGLVAIEDNRPVGAAAIGLDVTTNLTPSVIGLVVVPACRRRGIAKALFKGAEDLARRLGYRRLYVSSSVLSDWLDRSGWEALGAVRFLNDERGSIYGRDL